MDKIKKMLLASHILKFETFLTFKNVTCKHTWLKKIKLHYVRKMSAFTVQ